MIRTMQELVTSTAVEKLYTMWLDMKDRVDSRDSRSSSPSSSSPGGYASVDIDGANEISGSAGVEARSEEEVQKHTVKRAVESILHYISLAEMKALQFIVPVPIASCNSTALLRDQVEPFPHPLLKPKKKAKEAKTAKLSPNEVKEREQQQRILYPKLGLAMQVHDFVDCAPISCSPFILQLLAMCSLPLPLSLSPSLTLSLSPSPSLPLAAPCDVLPLASEDGDAAPG
jgi:hypothetical protein